MVKVIFVDIDGTLKNDSGIVTKRTKDAIRNISSLGIEVIICTGRPRRYTEILSKECGASRYIITSSGAEVYDYLDKKIIYETKIDPDACEKLYAVAQDIGARFIMHNGYTRVCNYVKNDDEILLTESIKDFLSKTHVTQCVITGYDFDKFKSIRSTIEGIDNIKIMNQSKCLIDDTREREEKVYYDIANETTSKGRAVLEYCKRFDIPIDTTIAIGDDYNDLSMFEVVGLSVAMGNSSEYVKSSVDKVIGTNNEDGIAIFLEELYDEQKN